MIVREKGHPKMPFLIGGRSNKNAVNQVLLPYRPAGAILFPV